MSPVLYFFWQTNVWNKAHDCWDKSWPLYSPYMFPHQPKVTVSEALLLATEVPYIVGVSEQPIQSKSTLNGASPGWKVVWRQSVEGPECQAKSSRWKVTRWQQHFKKIQLTVSFWQTGRLHSWAGVANQKRLSFEVTNLHWHVEPVKENCFSAQNTSTPNVWLFHMEQFSSSLWIPTGSPII